ncbi:hypothetical protein SAMD00019534_089040, partial [Acytostelium subglobosum LB1]|uniref:hypothetical protein n=1 Tax=Acytostelium subglobosum LB1 TaxID=1410327 RepID=UPI000644C5FC
HKDRYRIGKRMKSIIRAKRVVIGSEIKPATIVIENGVTVQILPYEHSLPLGEYGVVRDCADNEVLMGGLVDSHVHVNEPGRTEWEGFVTATSAAAAGGVTTIIDMPLNSDPVTTSFDALQAKIASMQGKCFVDVGLLGGIIPNNEDQIKRMVLEGGVVGFKSFLVHSGIDEFPHVNRQQVDKAMKVMAELKQIGKDVVMMFHAEVPEPIDEAIANMPADADPRDYNTFLSSRPKASENQAIDMVIDLTKANNVRTHIVHLSSNEAIPSMRAALDAGVPITAETTFHYLFFVSEQVPHGATLYKCCPPIRESDNRVDLWSAVQDGTIELIVSDHSPCTVNLKLLDLGDFMKAWGGISSLQFGLSIIWSEAKKRGIDITKFSRWMSDSPAALVNMNDRKGSIKVGRDADFVVWDPEQTFVVDPSIMYVKNRASPYIGQQLYGQVIETILRGRPIYTSKQGHIKEFSGVRIVPTNIHTLPTYPSCHLPPIIRLNQLDKDTFDNTIHLLFEKIPMLFQQLYDRRPFTCYEHLVDTAQDIMANMSTADRTQCLNSHSRIGATVTQMKSVSSLSVKEQSASGAQQETPEQVQAVHEELQRLNKLYEDKYGFRFIVFVNGRPKSAIVPVFQERLDNGKPESELALGLSELVCIARDRLKKL